MITTYLGYYPFYTFQIWCLHSLLNVAHIPEMLLSFVSGFVQCINWHLRFKLSIKKEESSVLCYLMFLKKRDKLGKMSCCWVCTSDWTDRAAYLDYSTYFTHSSENNLRKQIIYKICSQFKTINYILYVFITTPSTFYIEIYIHIHQFI